MSELSDMLTLAEKLYEGVVYFIIGLPNEIELRMLAIDREVLEQSAAAVEDGIDEGADAAAIDSYLRAHIDAAFNDFGVLDSVMLVGATHALMRRNPKADPVEIATYRYATCLRERNKLRVGCDVERDAFLAAVEPMVADRASVILSPDEWDAALAVKH